MKRILFVFIWLVRSGFTGDTSALFEQANKAYESGDYIQAIQLYEEIVQSGYENGELYYNLANAYYKNKQNARAILNYERARKFIPQDEDLKINLQVAGLSVPDKITPLPRLFLWEWLVGFRDFFGMKLLGWLSVIGFGCTFIFASFWIWSGNRRGKSLVILVGGICLFFSIFFLWAVYDSKNLMEAVVQEQKIAVYSAPDESSTELFMLHEGVKVRVIENGVAWIEIRLVDGKVGWMKKNAVEMI